MGTQTVSVRRGYDSEPRMIRLAKAEALFASPLQPSEHPSADQVAAAIRQTVRHLHVWGCAAVVATEYGDHPEIAVTRMQWVLTVVSR